MGRCAWGGEREIARMGWRGPSFPLHYFSVGCCFSFKLEKEKGKPECLQSRLIIAERLGAGTPCVHFHTCADGLHAYFAAGAASLESMWEHACFL